MSNHERTGWRDEWISKEHRTWGTSLYATDVDFLLLEYHFKRGVMMLDYKHVSKRGYVNFDDASIAALKDMCNKAQLPFCICLYDPLGKPEPTFELYPLNWVAQKKFGEHSISFGRRDFIRLQYQMRGIAMNKFLEEMLENLPASAELTPYPRKAA